MKLSFIVLTSYSKALAVFTTVIRSSNSYEIKEAPTRPKHKRIYEFDI